VTLWFYTAQEKNNSLHHLAHDLDDANRQLALTEIAKIPKVTKHGYSLVIKEEFRELVFNFRSANKLPYFY